MASYVFYIGLLVVLWLLSFLGHRSGKRSFAWLIIGILTLVAGLRDSSVGIDTANYLRLFSLIGEGDLHLAYGLEASFKHIVYGLLRLIPSTRFLLIFFAFITNWCVITRCWELRKISSFVCMVLCYYMAFFFMSMTGVRQFVAVGIVFYASRYLAEKKLSRFVLGVMLAMLFHRTAVIGFALLAVNCLRWKELPGRQKLFYIFAVLMAPVLLLLALRLFARYGSYFSHPSADVGLMLPLKLLFLAGTAMFVFALHRRGSYFRSDLNLTGADRYQMLMAGLGYMMALCMAMLGYVFPYMDRIGWYFYLFEGVYFGMLMKGKNPVNRLVFGYFIAFVIGYGFLYSMANNSQGTMPYSFFR